MREQRDKEQEQEVVVAIAGNPNSGKTSIFNQLTGIRQHVGNYPGVTVEKKEGHYKSNGRLFRVLDLPGTYSLSARTLEEQVARSFLLESRPSVVVNVVEEANLERNLYLTTQLMEFGMNLVLVLNMADEARRSGLRLDLRMLSERMGGIPVVETEGHKGRGIEELKQAVDRAAGRPASPPMVFLGQDMEQAVALVGETLNGVADGLYPSRAMAIRLLEGDELVEDFVRREHPDPEFVLSIVSQHQGRLESLGGENIAVQLADRRYGFSAGLLREATLEEQRIDRLTLSDRIDQVLTHRVLGLPLFFAVLYAIFWLTFRLGEFPMNGIETLFQWLGNGIASVWAPGYAAALRSLVLDGIIAGVGGVVVFLPNILLLFLGLSILEDTGYMARAAFLMDGLMHKIGLHGKSFIPMMVGFGCTVPAVLACRTLDNRRDRLTTMLVLPLFSCGARLPIYLLIVPAFFPGHMRAAVLMGIYLFGVLLAAGLARLLRSTVLAGEDSPFVMELPPYRVPLARGVLLHMWERARLYLRKAGTIILGVSIALWATTTFPRKPESLMKARPVAAAQSLAPSEIENMQAMERLEYSLAGRVGHEIEPLVRPMGFDWKIGTALIGAFAAKEVFVSQMGIVFALGSAEKGANDRLRDRLQRDYSPLVGLSILVFCLVASPCISTLVMTGREAGGWKWVALQWFGLTALGYGLAVLVYQAGSLLGLG
jgi:ferrous iron transport protein B